ncbi:hypothetical protein NC653_004902 [Populus alba x Populus x berolinensis]|uniref:Uncharacterized protein n=1 Tax=Populus alba x Populus x berolinensis TaxID=444605 RepID=A0AAD6RAK9_9ROSI|nr:hypothetical protein NC653_004902 [Populus alba x Populus x berolinensis]
MVLQKRADPDSLSQSEPNIATTFWRNSRKKVIAEQRTASSSNSMVSLESFFICPEHPSLQARGRSMLSGDRHSIRDYADDVATSRILHSLSHKERLV